MGAVTSIAQRFRSLACWQCPSPRPSTTGVVPAHVDVVDHRALCMVRREVVWPCGCVPCAVCHVVVVVVVG